MHLPALRQLRGWAESRCGRQRAGQMETPQATPAPATKEDLAMEQPVGLRWPQAPGRSEQTPSPPPPAQPPLPCPVPSPCRTAFAERFCVWPRSGPRAPPAQCLSRGGGGTDHPRCPAPGQWVRTVGPGSVCLVLPLALRNQDHLLNRRSGPTPQGCVSGGWRGKAQALEGTLEGYFRDERERGASQGHEERVTTKPGENQESRGSRGWEGRQVPYGKEGREQSRWKAMPGVNWKKMHT